MQVPGVVKDAGNPVAILGQVSLAPFKLFQTLKTYYSYSRLQLRLGPHVHISVCVRIFGLV